MEQEPLNDLGIEPVPAVTEETMGLLNQQYPGINEGIMAARAALNHMISIGIATATDEL